MSLVGDHYSLEESKRLYPIVVSRLISESRPSSEILLMDLLEATIEEVTWQGISSTSVVQKSSTSSVFTVIRRFIRKLTTWNMSS